MSPTAVIVMSVFAALALLVIILSVRQSRQQRGQMQEIAAARGGSVSARDLQLEAILERLDPTTSWTAREIARFASTRLFLASMGSRNSRSSPSSGVACLVERSAPAISAPVMLARRVPLIEKMIQNRVAEVGGEEFRRGWVAASPDPQAPHRAITAEVQRALIEHDNGPAWVLTAYLSSEAAVVFTTWAKTPDDWDYLVRLTQRLARYE